VSASRRRPRSRRRASWPTRGPVRRAVFTDRAARGWKCRGERSAKWSTQIRGSPRWGGALSTWTGGGPRGRGGGPRGREAAPRGRGGAPLGRGAVPRGRGGAPLGRGAVPRGRGGAPLGKERPPRGREGTSRGRRRGAIRSLDVPRGVVRSLWETEPSARAPFSLVAMVTRAAASAPE